MKNEVQYIFDVAYHTASMNNATREPGFARIDLTIVAPNFAGAMRKAKAQPRIVHEFISVVNTQREVIR